MIVFLISLGFSILFFSFTGIMFNDYLFNYYSMRKFITFFGIFSLYGLTDFLYKVITLLLSVSNDSRKYGDSGEVKQPNELVLSDFEREKWLEYLKDNKHSEILSKEKFVEVLRSNG